MTVSEQRSVGLPSIMAKFSAVAADISLNKGNIPVHFTFIAEDE